MLHEVFRLYSQEWGIVHTVTAVDGMSAVDLSRDWAVKNLTEEVLKARRVRYRLRNEGKSKVTSNVTVLVNYYQGEYPMLHNAESIANFRGYGEYVIVRAGSAEDNEMSASVWLPYD